MRSSLALAVAVAAVLGADAPAAALHRYVVTTLATGGTAIRIVEPGRPARTVASGSPLLRDASWSADGTVLAWVGRGLAAARADGTRPHVVVATPTDCTAFCGLAYDWSPSGHRLVVTGAGDAGMHAVAVDAATGASEDVTPPADDETHYYAPRWSRRGDLIAYVRERGTEGTTTCCALDLVVARPDGSGLRTLVHLFEPIHDSPFASWSPDGRRIAFTTDGRDRRDPRLGVVDVATRTVRRLDRLQPYTTRVSWSRDSRRIAFGSVKTHRIVTVGADGRAVRRLRASGDRTLWGSDGVLTAVRGGDLVETRDAPGASVRIVYHGRQGIISADRS